MRVIREITPLYLEQKYTMRQATICDTLEGHFYFFGFDSWFRCYCQLLDDCRRCVYIDELYGGLQLSKISLRITQTYFCPVC